MLERISSVSITRTIDARGSYCPGPLMELIRAIREGAVGDVIAVLSSDSGSQDRYPQVGREGRAIAWSASRPRDGYDEIVVEKLR